MQGNIRKKLIQHKKSTILLSELEALYTAKTKNPSYDNFAREIINLEKEGVLEMVKKKGRNEHSPSLAYHYRIHRAKLMKGHHEQILAQRLIFHPAMNLDAYFSLNMEIWQKDLPYLKRVNNYICKYGFPTDLVPAPERSFELVQDEKWIVEGRGSELLTRIGLWEKLKILPVSDPLMFAINPNQMNNTNHLHLIVENKTTYQALLPALTKTRFTTLIYGCGNKITKNIENFDAQVPLKGDHQFLYFGDLDQSGITIWHSLNKRSKVDPAYPFYHACLQKRAVKGKTNQRPNPQALEEFLVFFPTHEQEKIKQILYDGAYYPQEILKTKELQEIWRDENGWGKSYRTC